jgi:hypothetical protein
LLDRSPCSAKIPIAKSRIGLKVLATQDYARWLLELEEEEETMRKVEIFLLVVAIGLACAATQPALAAAPDPLESIQIVPPDPNLPKEVKFFSGYWEGTWIGDRAAVRETARLVVSEIINKEEVVATAATNLLITRDKERVKIKRQKDGYLYIEFPPIPEGTLIYVGYPKRGEIKAIAQGRTGSLEATLKKKQR